MAEHGRRGQRQGMANEDDSGGRTMWKRGGGRGGRRSATEEAGGDARLRGVGEYEAAAAAARA